VEKLASVVVHQIDRAIDRIAVHVDVEHGQKNRNPDRPFLYIHGLVGFDHVDDVTFGGGHYVALTAWSRPYGIAKEGHDPDRENGQNDGQRPPQQCGSERQDPGPCDEWPSFARYPHSNSVPVMRRYASR